VGVVLRGWLLVNMFIYFEVVVRHLKLPKVLQRHQ
jgi:hypothetical protein